MRRPDALRLVPVVRQGTATLLIGQSNFIWVAERDASKTMAQCWECPGGGSEKGEKLIDCAMREVKEETGLVIAKERFDFRGMIIVDGWDVVLYMVNLFVDEVPKDTEAGKRSGWILANPEQIRLRHMTPALGALVSILFQEGFRGAQAA